MRHFLADDDLTSEASSGRSSTSPTGSGTSRSRSTRFARGREAVAVLFDKPAASHAGLLCRGIAELGGYPMSLTDSLSRYRVAASRSQTRHGCWAASVAGDGLADLRPGPDRGDGGHVGRACRQRADRPVSPLPGPGRPPDRAGQRKGALAGLRCLRRRRRQQHGPLLPARRRAGRAARPDRRAGPLPTGGSRRTTGPACAAGRAAAVR